MFKVVICQKNHCWNKFVFKFETLEEAQQFVLSAIDHFVKEKDDEDAEDMVISIELRQKFTTAKEEENNEAD